MKKTRILIGAVMVLALLCGCKESEKPMTSFEDKTSIDSLPANEATESEQSDPAESTPDLNEPDSFAPDTGHELETFFSVEEYDYTAETNQEILAYFGGNPGEALTKLAPSLKAVAYAAYSYPEDMVNAPKPAMLWSAIYSMVETYHQYPSEHTTDSEGRLVITGSAKLKAMVADMFTADVGEIGAPHEDFLDSMIYYDAATDQYTFEPAGGEGLVVRLCALELIDGHMNVTIQLYNPNFDFTSWVIMEIAPDTDSVYGYTVSSAKSWTEDTLDEEDQ